LLIYIYHPGLHSPERAAGIAGRLEELGYDGIAMPDHLFIPNFITGEPQSYAHGPTVLTTCAAVTSRIALVPLMANVLVRPPVELAHAAATLARVAGPGRVGLGVGTGWFRWEFEAAGLAFPPGRERRGRLVEAVGIWRALLHDGSADLDGRYYRVHVPPGGFLPPGSDVPIMVGAAGPRMIQAAAAVADRIDFQPDSLQSGTIDLAQYDSYDQAKLAAGVSLARETRPGIPVSGSPFVQILADAAEARAAHAERAERLDLTEATIRQSLGTIVGTGEEVVQRLGAYADAGCDRVHVQAVDEDVADRLAPFLPELHAMASAPGPNPVAR
jgi:alkanesulfonate monooxygenase SsuD/methylene tetrahydromethanopterin reductase-like flavin-dependent oxidoreductase (luciferase family)